MMMKKKNLQILLICGVLLVTACKSKSKEEQQSGYRMEGDTVQITDRFLSEIPLNFFAYFLSGSGQNQQRHGCSQL